MSRNVGTRLGGVLWRRNADRSSLNIAQASGLSVQGRWPLTSPQKPSFAPISTVRSLGLSVSFRNNLTGNEDGAATLATAAWRRRIAGQAISAVKTEKRCFASHKGKSPLDSKRPQFDTESSRSVPEESKKASVKDEKTDASQEHSGMLSRFPHALHLHRPSKEELLAAATGFWSRLRVRFKWFAIRSGRPYTFDEITGFLTWILAGHVLWIILGTTTFFSLTIFMINTVFAQETLARWIGNYLTQSTGVKVVFESAVVPKWKDGVISFQKVFISRRPGQGRSTVSKGSQTSAAAAAAAAARREKDGTVEEEEDTNYTQFDISIDTVNVTLSFSKWFNSKGLLQDVEIKGIRGVVDRTSVRPLAEPVDPYTFRHEHNPGDFELDSFKMEDLLVTIYQPNGFRPFPVSIYSCELPRLRQQWLFYDFMSASMMSGSYDDSLFTIHPRQVHNHTGAPLSGGQELGDVPTQWKKHSRVRIDSLNIDHLNRGIEGPFSWIHEGNVDIVADVMLPTEGDGSIAKVMSDFYDRMEATVSSNSYQNQPQKDDPYNIKTGHLTLDTPQLPLREQKVEDEDDKRFIVMDLRVHLNDVRAAVPLFSNDMSYVNSALIRPIVAYINSQKTFIPVNCRIVKKLSDFNGAWTTWDSGLMEDLSREMYDAFSRNVSDDAKVRKRRFKKVGIWSLQLVAQALFIGLAGNIA